MQLSTRLLIRHLLQGGDLIVAGRDRIIRMKPPVALHKLRAEGGLERCGLAPRCSCGLGHEDQQDP